MHMCKFIIIVMIIWVVLRGILLYFLWVGNRSEVYKKEVLKYFTEEDIKNGIEYSKKGFGAKAIYGYLELLLLILFIYYNINTQLFSLLEKYVSNSFWVNSAIYIVTFSIIMSLVELPFSFYLEYVCEKEAGFINMNVTYWLWKWLKMNLVGIIIQLIPILVFIGIVKNFENSWQIIIPIVFTLYGALITIIFPVVITPIFYEQKKLQNPSLRDKILEIAVRVGIDVDDVYEINESAYSKHTNAYFTGLGKRKRIVMFDNLLKNHTEEEILTIFAHEAGHWKHNHIAKGLAIGFIGLILGCYLIKFLFINLKELSYFDIREIWHPTMLPVINIISIVVSLFIAPIQSQISQYFEKQADITALQLTSSKQSFISTQVRLARDNKSNLLPHPFRVFWLHSHPPTLERIKLAESLGK